MRTPRSTPACARGIPAAAGRLVRWAAAPGLPLLVLLSLAPLFAPVARAEEVSDEEYREALEMARDIEENLLETVREVRTHSVSVRHLRLPKGATEPRLVGVGSGVVVRHQRRTWIITNVHVIKDAYALEVVTYDGEVHPVVIQDTIPAYDIACLRFTDSKAARTHRGVRLRPRVSESDRRLREGTWVIATGNPFFLALDGRSVTTLGVVSGKERYLGGQFQYVDAIQHDTEVNPGNSGGPLWNLDGDLVGINGKIAMTQRAGGGPSNTGASFSLPVHQVDEFMPMLTRSGDARSAYLGIDTETVTDERGRAVGARIVKIHRNSPVNEARKRKRPRAGDRITRIIVDGSVKRIYTAKDLRNVLSVTLAGAKTRLFWFRGRDQMEWKGELGGR